MMHNHSCSHIHTTETAEQRILFEFDCKLTKAPNHLAFRRDLCKELRVLGMQTGPLKLMQTNRKQQIPYLDADSSSTWEVNIIVSSISHSVYISKGWSRFLLGNKLSPGDTLRFYFRCNHIWSVFILQRRAPRASTRVDRRLLKHEAPPSLPSCRPTVQKVEETETSPIPAQFPATTARPETKLKQRLRVRKEIAVPPSFTPAPSPSSTVVKKRQQEGSSVPARFTAGARYEEADLKKKRQGEESGGEVHVMKKRQQEGSSIPAKFRAGARYEEAGLKKRRQEEEAGGEVHVKEIQQEIAAIFHLMIKEKHLQEPYILEAPSGFAVQMPSRSCKVRMRGFGMTWSSDWIYSSTGSGSSVIKGWKRFPENVDDDDGHSHEHDVNIEVGDLLIAQLLDATFPTIHIYIYKEGCGKPL